jgi:hypothetical protein
MRKIFRDLPRIESAPFMNQRNISFFLWSKLSEYFENDWELDVHFQYSEI